MGKIADPLRERILRFEELGIDENNPMLIQTLEACANQIDNEHARRMSQSRREVRRDFARYMRSCIADYVDGTARRNRNHAHVRVVGDGSATCTNCGTSIGTYDHYCCRCGAKITATEYGSTDESDDTCELELTFNMSYARCNKCQYTMPRGTNLSELKECPNCGRRIVWEGC